LLASAAESMALEASARVAVTNAIENKEDLGGMLGTACHHSLLDIDEASCVTGT